MNDPQYVPPYQPQQPKRPAAPFKPSRSAAWAPILIVCCLALGFTASAVEYERIRAVGERNRANIIAAGDSVIRGQLEDVGRFLSDSQTRWIHLTNPAAADGMRAVIAFNAQTQTGYLFCDQLPPLDAGTNYELWTIRGAADPQSVAAFSPHSGVSVYSFHFQGDSLVVGNRLEITAGPRSISKTPILTGEID